ncbi:MAG: 16S rRNA (adenine(1518)-N(6)/adenine(1519)-N(6))-dimethyltransferase RsmA [Pyrinomonadaceae bacterium]
MASDQKRPDELEREFPPRAKRSLGQNFLVDPNFIRKIVAALEPTAGDRIVEIGPGRGALTELLVESGAGVTAIELDRELAPALAERFGASERFRVVEGDALEFDFRALASGAKLKLVANLPYYVSTAILQRLAEQHDAFGSLVLMFQREVVERITARPGTAERGFLTVIAEAHFEIEKLFDVPPQAFRPVPKIWSSVVRLVPRASASDIPSAFRGVASAAFRQPRKTILNNLKAGFADAAAALGSAGIDPRRRAESLTADEWVALARRLDR